MEERPVTRYATTADGVTHAYQTAGTGPLDLLVLGGFTVPLDLMWEEPSLVRFRNRLSRFTHTVWMEPPTWGASDRDTSGELAVETFAYEAVLDAVGSARVTLLGCGMEGLRPFATRHITRSGSLL